MAAAGGRRMVQKESQAALEERESERSANPAAASGASLAPPAAAAPGEDNPSGAGAAAVSGAAGGTRRFLCGVVEGELAFQPRPGVQHLCVPRPPGGARWCFLVGLPPPGRELALANAGVGEAGEAGGGHTSFPPGPKVPFSWLLGSLTPPSVGLEPGRRCRRRRWQGACRQAQCFASLYLGILVPRVVCF